jgi:large subunit ribosomal protein L9
MKVILASDVDKLGRKGDVVSVADGFARNYLVPNGLALIATKGSLRQADLMQKARAEKERKVKDEAAGRVAKLAAAPVYISARAGEGGKLFVSKSSSARPSIGTKFTWKTRSARSEASMSRSICTKR